jgi:hypothetical protein
MEMATMSKADIFSVWGVPSDAILKGMSTRQIKLLKSYIEGTTGQAYRMGYDNGLVEGLCKISSTAASELKKQRDRMARS